MTKTHGRLIVTLTMSQPLITTGICHVVAADHGMPFWVEARTYRNAPVFGSDKRLRGFDTIERATRFMKRMTRDALAADPSLKRYLTSLDGSTPPVSDARSGEASGTHGGAAKEARPRGRPPGAKNKVKPKVDGRRKKETSDKEPKPFVSTRFVPVPQGLNAKAQVWVCNQNRTTTRDEVPHSFGDHAVSILVEDSLVFASDDDAQPLIYPSFETAERDARHFYDTAPEAHAFPLSGTLVFRADPFEVHRTSNRTDPFVLFDTQLDSYVLGSGSDTPLGHARLDAAIASARNCAEERRNSPPSVKLVAALMESDAERAERIMKDDMALEQQRIADLRKDEQFEEDERMFAEMRAKAPKRRVLTGAEKEAAIAAARDKRVIIKNPTQEQKNAARRRKQATRGVYRERAGAMVENDDAA